MIAYEDVIARHPELASEDEETVKRWIDSANRGIPDARVKGNEDPDYARSLFVVHALTKPPLNLEEAFTPRSQPKAKVDKRHKWSTTEHGRQLIQMVKY